MPDMLAIISKAQFESLAPDAKPGDVLSLDRYNSTSKALGPLAEGGALFLVTVRPPDERLWLVGILERPRIKAGSWRAAASTTPIRDVTELRGQLRFSTGAGIQAKRGALGMSLQTPRQLTAEDARLLRGAATKATASAAATKQAAKGKAKGAEAKPAKPPAKGKAKPAEEKAGKGKPPKKPSAPEMPVGDYVEAPPRPLTPAAARLWQQILDDPDDLQARAVLADQLMEQGDPLGEFIQLASPSS